MYVVGGVSVEVTDGQHGDLYHGQHLVRWGRRPAASGCSTKGQSLFSSDF